MCACTAIAVLIAAAQALTLVWNRRCRRRRCTAHTRVYSPRTSACRRRRRIWPGHGRSRPSRRRSPAGRVLLARAPLGEPLGRWRVALLFVAHLRRRPLVLAVSAGNTTGRRTERGCSTWMLGLRGSACVRVGCNYGCVGSIWCAQYKAVVDGSAGGD